ncbi:hypothetical protein ABPG75_011988 [Micractinium tetrahymenae]
MPGMPAGPLAPPCNIAPPPDVAPLPLPHLPAGFSLDDPNTFAGRIYRMVKLGLSIDEDAGEAAAADDDLPELEENVAEGSRMEEVRGWGVFVLFVEAKWKGSRMEEVRAWGWEGAC